MFLPTTPEELKTLGWDALDVILVSGDTYIDSPFSGIALIGKLLVRAGYRVGVIAQPSTDSPDDITRLGEPKLFWGVSAGAVDSMVSNTTPLGKPRKYDDYTPGGLNTRRPDRATIVYTNLIRRHFKQTVPVVLGGIEASLRRVTHYDFWSDSLRRSVLLDSKADYLLYGMADLSILELAEALRAGREVTSLRGLCYLSHAFPEGYLELPSYEAVTADPDQFRRMFDIFYHNNDPISAKGLAQRYADRFVVQNPPARTLTTEEMDQVYDLRFENAVHPYYAAQGEVRALETIRFAIPTHRGCYGECNFCAIAVHEGRRVSWRSQSSILAEAERMTRQPGFKGIITDLSGPTANMYGYECRVKTSRGACQDKSCIYPEVCPLLGLTHELHLRLLRELRQLPAVRKVFIGSGIRHDLVMADGNFGEDYLEELAAHHVSGQLKLAPEHAVPHVLRRMRKPGISSLLAFKRQFDRISALSGKEQYLTYYLIAAYPGCDENDMRALRDFASQELHTLPEQVQIFTPTPSTYASLMYYTEKDPFTGEALFVEKGLTEKMRQKAVITGWRSTARADSGRKEGIEMNRNDDNHEQRGKPRGRGPNDRAPKPYPRREKPYSRSEGSPGQDRYPSRGALRSGSSHYSDRPEAGSGPRQSDWAPREKDENRPPEGAARGRVTGREERPAGQRGDHPAGRKEGFRPPRERDDAPRSAASGDRAPKPVRVVRDDNGGFFMNRRPEGWVDKKSSRDRTGSQGVRPKRWDSDRPKSAEGDRPKRYDSDRPSRSYGQGQSPDREARGGRPDYRPRREGCRPASDSQRASSDARPSGTFRARRESRPYPPSDKSSAPADPPARGSSDQRSYQKSSRPEDRSRSQQGRPDSGPQNRSGRPASSRPSFGQRGGPKDQRSGAGRKPANDRKDRKQGKDRHD